MFIFQYINNLGTLDSTFRAFASCRNVGQQHGEQQDSEDDAEAQNGGDFDVRHTDGKPCPRHQRIDVVVHRQEHFEADEHQDDSNAVLEIFEVFREGGEGEIEGAKAENGENVARQDDERIARHAEHRRNGIDGENHVGQFDGEQCQKQRRGQAATGFDDEKFVAVKLVGHGKRLAHPTHDEILREIGLFVAVAEHFCARVEQKQAEQPQNPLESVDDGNACKDKNAAQDECAENAPKEHFVLVFAIDAEEGE